ncbi:unnamed protein product [Effrenium voratum]|uniref:C3H1-type domain-containing protein n=1 Tax=Effrenium voratum TaxID=2562239 RepID=A0AA36HPL0_9DINO|nr:unnamed protein product [Effrenium voratum]
MVSPKAFGFKRDLDISEFMGFSLIEDFSIHFGLGYLLYEVAYELMDRHPAPPASIESVAFHFAVELARHSEEVELGEPPAHQLANIAPCLRLLCRKWAKGSCNFANCTFAHGEHELRGVERGSKRFDGKERMNDSDVASDTTKSDEGQSRYSDGLEECCGQLMLLHVQAAAMAARDQREESETPLDLWSREFDLKADMPMKATDGMALRYASLSGFQELRVVLRSHSR